MHDRLIVSLANTEVIEAAMHLRIYAYPFKNPPSMASIVTFSGWTGDSSGNEIESFADAYHANTLPNEFGSESFVDIIGDTTGVLTDFDLISATDLIYEFTLYTYMNDIPNYGKITVGWPDDWTLDCTLTYTVSCDIGCNFDTTSCDSTNNLLELLNGYDPTLTNTMQPYVMYQVGQIIFQISGITNPDTDVMKYFTITSWHYHTDGNFYEIDSSYTMFDVSFSVGSITINDIYPDTALIYSTEGNYYFSFTPEHDITTDMILTIDIPSELQVQQNSACILTETDDFALASTYSCKADANNNQIVLQNYMDADATGGTTFDLYISSIRNPGDYSTPGAVYMTYETTSGGQVDYGSFSSWTDGATLFENSFIETFTVSSSSLMSSDTPVVYYFNLGPYSRVTQGCYLVVDLPVELEVSNINSLARGCSDGDISGFSYSVLTCTYSSANHQITLANGFQFAYSDGDPPEIYFSLTNFRNPRSMAPTELFNVTIYSEDSDALFYFNSSAGPSVQMTSVPTPASISYERSNEINGVKSNYTWSIETFANYYLGDVMTMELPNGIRYTDDSKSIGVSFWIDSEQSSVLSGDRQEIEITLSPNDENSFIQYVPGGSIINIMLTEITSPTSFRPLEDSIHYYVKNSDGYLIEMTQTDLTVQNTEIGSIDPATAGVTPDYWENNILANYTFAWSFLNFEQNLQIWITVPPEILIPSENQTGPINCRGFKGTDDAQLTCTAFYDNSSIFISDAVTSKEIAPAQVMLILESLQNPNTNIVTESFIIETRTWDGHPMDKIDQGLEVNFYCIFPCRDCKEETPSVCDLCYTATTEFIYLFDDTCLEACPNGMYIIDEDTIIPSCDFCEFPCQNCEKNATDCAECYPGYIYYEAGHYCYEEIIWYFPFCGACVLAFLIVFAGDYYRRSTNMLHSLLYLLCWIEDAVLGYLLYMWYIGQIDGDRSLTIISLGCHVMLNLTFMAVHLKLMIGKGPIEYQQLFQNYGCSSYCISLFSYILNFKMSVMLISQFAGRPRFSGKLNRDGWQKFNIFAILYIILVYLPFTADFYVYFTTYGLRKLTSFIAAEACIIQTIISLILMLEIISQCACSGVNEQDLGNRAQLNGKKKKGTKIRRKARRSGMGNDEESYGEEYGSEDSWDEEEMKRAVEAEVEYYDEEEQQESEEEKEEEEEEEEETKGGNIKKGERMNELEMLALQMKMEKDALLAEQKKMIDDKLKILEEKEKYLNEFDIQKKLDDQQIQVNQDLQQTKEDMDAKIMAKLLEHERDSLIRRNDKPTIVLPLPVQAEIEYSRSVDGDEEYWLQNISGIQGELSEGVIEKDASLIEFMEPDDAKQSVIGSIREGYAEEEMHEPASAKLSFIGSVREREANEEMFQPASAKLSHMGSVREIEANEEMRLAQSQSGIKQTNISYRASDHVDEVENVSALFGDNDPRSLNGKSMNEVRQSAVFGDNTPRADETGNSDESDEGVVADHRPFNGIKQAMEKSHEELRNSEVRLQSIQKSQEELRRSEMNYGRDSAPNINPMFSGRTHNSQPDEFDLEIQEMNKNLNLKEGINKSMNSIEDDEDGKKASGRRRIKQVIYSDKSESSIDDQMDDTPSNYNLANGRIDGKSMGLKAILLYAKKQGVQVGTRTGQDLEEIKEINDYNPGSRNQARTQLADYPKSNLNGIAGGHRHSLDMSSGVDDWKPMSKPLKPQRQSNIQIAGHDEVRMNANVSSMTIEYDSQNQIKSKTKRNPGFKQFKEPGDVDPSGRFKQGDLGSIQKNNFTVDSNEHK